MAPPARKARRASLESRRIRPQRATSRARPTMPAVARKSRAPRKGGSMYLSARKAEVAVLRPRQRQGTEGSLPASESAQDLLELGGRKVGPHRLTEEQLGVGAFPEQKIREPLLGAGPDQQIDGRNRRATVVHQRQQLLEALASEFGVVAADPVFGNPIRCAQDRS